MTGAVYPGEKNTSASTARMSDGSLWSGGADVIVTQAACIDGT